VDLRERTADALAVLDGDAFLTDDFAVHPLEKRDRLSRILGNPRAVATRERARAWHSGGAQHTQKLDLTFGSRLRLLLVNPHEVWGTR
jgi:hypothetical protein